MGYVDSSKNLPVGKGVIQMMVRDEMKLMGMVIFAMAILVMCSACGSLNATEMGKKAREVEEALCPYRPLKT